MLLSLLHPQVHRTKPAVNEHIRVAFTVVTLSQAKLPLEGLADDHISESLDTGSADLMASRATAMGKVTAAQYAASSLSSLSGAPQGAPDRVPTGQQTGPDCLAGQA